MPRTPGERLVERFSARRASLRGTSASESRDGQIRLAILAEAAELGYTGSAEDGAHVLVLPGCECFFHEWVEHALPEWKLLLTPGGRRWRRLGDGVWHEWEERGSIDLLAHEVEL